METIPFVDNERERLLHELVKNYRLAVVGRRLTGIIHTINTSLQVILMQSELMERKLKEEQDTFASDLPAVLVPKWQELFHYRQNKNQQLHEVSTNLQQLVHWLKPKTSYDDSHGIQELDVNKLLLEELEGYQAEQFFKHRVEKRFRWCDRLPPIAGFHVDISQSFCHLVDNALEALREVPEPVLSITTTMESGRRVIVVGDNGPGIPQKNQDKIFQPFFTTKSSPEKPRAGLGLYLTRRLLTPYGGEVFFESHPGQTFFRIVLP